MCVCVCVCVCVCICVYITIYRSILIVHVVNLFRKFSVHLTRDQSILAPNFTVEVVHDDHIELVDVDLNFYRGFLEGLFTLFLNNSSFLQYA